MKATVTHAVGLILICLSAYYFVEAAESALFDNDGVDASLPPEGTLGRQLALALLTRVDDRASPRMVPIGPGQAGQGANWPLPLDADPAALEWLSGAVAEESARERRGNALRGVVWLVLGSLLLGFARRKPRPAHASDRDVPERPAQPESAGPPLRRIDDAAQDDSKRYAPPGY